jgi:hypothetical protein
MGSLTFQAPAAGKGDVLLALLSHSAVDTVSAAPSGWALVGTLGSGADVLDLYAHMVDGGELASIVFTLASNIDEWQGELVTLTGTSPGVLVEASASATFSATTALTTAGATAQQAIDLILVAWTCSGTPTLTLPAGFTAIDSFSTAVVTSRAMLVGYKLAGATGALTFSSATASVNTTGRSFTLVLRDRSPIAPAALVDLVPGNIGLIGKDTRPTR